MELTPRQIFDKYRSLRAMLHCTDDVYMLVQVCGFTQDRLIIAFRDEIGPIKEFHKGVLFDKGFFDGAEAKSYDIVSPKRLVFIDHNATERLTY